MAHVVADRYHLDMGVGKHLLATLHDRLFLAMEHQRIERLVGGYQGVAGNLVVADVGTELYESFFLSGQLQEMVIALGLDMEFLAGIHGETVDDHLTEKAVVDIGVPCRAQDTISMPTAEIAVNDARTLIDDQADRNDEDGREGIQYPHIQPSCQADKPFMHPPVAKGGSCPFLVGHLSASGCQLFSLQTMMECPCPRWSWMVSISRPASRMQYSMSSVLYILELPLARAVK